MKCMCVLLFEYFELNYEFFLAKYELCSWTSLAHVPQRMIPIECFVLKKECPLQNCNHLVVYNYVYSKIVSSVAMK